ncbi:MAG: hypothetical protein P4L83_01840 [Nevskia sp.]|nr:hypothetical protein [Nevskia sp.]
MRELTQMDRLWLVAQAHRGGNLVISASSRERLRKMDLITTRHNRSAGLTRLGYELALRLKQQMRSSAHAGAVLATSLPKGNIGISP